LKKKNASLPLLKRKDRKRVRRKNTHEKKSNEDILGTRGKGPSKKDASKRTGSANSYRSRGKKMSREKYDGDKRREKRLSKTIPDQGTGKPLKKGGGR